jgi:teichuronic acid biosynthesis glycosyltransferase TuaC
MKVLVFTTLFPNNVWPNHGVFVKERMCEVARLDGCEVKVVAPVPYFPRIKLNWRWKFSQIVRQEIRDEIDVYHPRYFMTPKLGMVLYGWLMFLCVLPRVKKIQKDFKFDLIDAHYVYPDGFAAVLLGWLFRKPVVVSARGSDINLYTKFPLIRRLLQFTLRRADKVISVCLALKQAMIELGVSAEKINVVPNGVDIEKFYRSNKEAARKELHLPTGRKIIISVGGLIPRKGFDLLIRAVKILSVRFGVENLYLVIVGEGPFRKELEKLISSLNLNDKVRLAGAIPHQDLYRWYSAADLSCLTSSREGWPNVLLESLACGTPVVGANTWGVPEIITSDEIGLLTERREEVIAETILVALKKQWQTENLLEYAKNHTWDHTALGVLRVFRAVVKESKIVSDGFSAGGVIKHKTAESDGAKHEG